MIHKYVTISVCALSAFVLLGCHSAAHTTISSNLEEQMLTACTKRVAIMYGVKSQKVLLPHSFGIDESGKNILNGQVDKGKEGYKEFRCIFDASNALVDVMAMSPDGE